MKYVFATLGVIGLGALAYVNKDKLVGAIDTLKQKRLTADTPA